MPKGSPLFYVTSAMRSVAYVESGGMTSYRPVFRADCHSLIQTVSSEVLPRTEPCPGGRGGRPYDSNTLYASEKSPELTPQTTFDSSVKNTVA